MNRYIINKGYYIRCDLDALLIYYDYFSQGISLPNYLGHIFIRRFIHSVLRIVIVLTYLLRIYKLFYKTTYLNEDAVLMVKGKGNWGSVIKLKRHNGSYKLVKQVKNYKIYNQEKNFYTKYANNPTDIKLPKHKFLSKNTIEIDFLKIKSFQRLLLDGSISFDKSLKRFEEIKTQLHKLYGNNKTIIHGDLWPGNIFIDKNTYYLIDLSDSHKNNYNYDLYSLLYSLLSTFHIIKINEYSLLHNKKIGELVKNKLDTDESILLKTERQFRSYRESRFPGVYYN